ncbi:serine hydrolase domain-containing protein [Algimonas porphyrae]|uniref:Beta-lactamase-related domain-containing protein n=1 Tax=Algimonas porphyrae TaxID=1128113 RepID=A0ABQ5V314_9PROT|nr:serine hydrolase domain-containing protein [Algimonas porphyrae]GLQ21918.1 hypothetical protein GCM10007854_28730 [Algimonas porphyrae]
MHKIGHSAFGILLSCAFGTLAYADNGELAYAFDAPSIKVDGDLSDWPEDVIRYDLDRQLIGDVDAYFQVAYNASEGAVYIGLSVGDDIHIASEDSLDTLNLKDSHILYLDPYHSKNGSAPFAFSAAGDDVTPVIDDESWAPAVRAAYPWPMSHAFSRREGVSVHEWSFNLGSEFTPGMTIGLDHIILDIDQPKSENLSSASMWGSYNGKTNRSGRLGDVMLVPDRADLGTVKGRIKWSDSIDGPDLSNWRIRIDPLGRKYGWVQVRSGEGGEFEFDLPLGNYRISSPFRLYNGSDETRYDLRLSDADIVNFQVRARETIDLGDIAWATRDPLKIPTQPGFLFDYDPSKEASLNAFIEEALDYYQIMGASIALIVDGELAYSQNFGFRNNYTQQTVDEATLFEAGSVTKPIFALAVLRLAERGVIDLDTPLADYLPLESPPEDIRYKKMTARHVLSHQTGLPNWRHQTSDGQLDLVFVPGTGFRYSGEGFEYLGRVVSHLTNKSLEMIFLDEIIRPFAVGENMIFKDTGALIDRVAFGHDFDRPNNAQLPENVGPAYSMQTNATSLAKVMTAMFDHVGLSTETYLALFEEQVLTPDPASSQAWPVYYGLGFQLIDTTFGPAISHTGLNGSNNAIFEGYLNERSGFIVLTNSDVGRQFYLDLREFLVVGGE